MLDPLLAPAVERVFQALAHFRAHLSPREHLVLELGLRRAHTDEARKTRELTRAAEHELRAIQLAAVLGALSAREQVIEQLGELGAHIEEAIAHGEIDRARTAFDKLMPLAEKLS
jgi:hypothetical protein